MSSLFARLFPIPSFFTMPTVGVDFSDATMRFIKLQEGPHGIVPTLFAELPIPTGCMQGGRISDESAFVTFLTSMRKKYALKYIRVAIPESQVYSFTLAIEHASKDMIRTSIEAVLEENIPLKTYETIFDYQILSTTKSGVVVQVVALSEAVSQGYLRAFTSAGLVPVSFELDGQALARAILRTIDKHSCMIVDIGATRTGVTIVAHGVAVYTSTLDIGGSTFVNVLTKELDVSVTEAHRLLHEYGFTASGEHKNIFTLLAAGATVLKEELYQRMVYWHEKKNQYLPLRSIDTVYITGGYSTIAGIADYLSAGLRIPVVQANPWTNCFSFEDEIPVLTHDVAQSYTTAIGLALAEYLYD